MSLISDVKIEIKNLELNKKNLRNFGLLVGGIFILISILFLFKTINIIFYFFIILGSGLVVLGAVFPFALKQIYRAWMGLAFTMGWIVSSLLIILLYYLMVTPIGLIARLVGKKFLDLRFREEKGTYWIIRSGDVKIDYRKMY
jgi:hypothetical protein